MDPSDLGALVTLDALLQTSSVSAAAGRLGLSTPAVSHALARLRERFGDPLLVRAGRRMVLTPRAEALRPQVHEALAVAAQVFVSPTLFEPETLDRTFTVSMTDYVLAVFGGALEERLCARAPNLDLRVLANAVDDPERLRSGETDLAIGIYGQLPPEMRTRPLITDRLICVVREGHPVVRKRLSIEQFTRLPHVQIAPRGRPGGYVDDLLAERGLSRRVARAFPYFRVALETTARADYILTVSERIARALGPQLGLRLLEPPLPLEPFALSMVWHPRFASDPGHTWLRQQLVEVTQALDHPGARRRLSASDPTTGGGRKRRPRRSS